jgi:hypothetical protein
VGNQLALAQQDLGAGDIARVVDALLEGIRRGELRATAREVEFLSSIDQLLSQLH